MVQMQANQHLLLQPWILVKRIGSILILGNILSMTLRVLCDVMHTVTDVSEIRLSILNVVLLVCTSMY
jgi:hypothetical protein